MRLIEANRLVAIAFGCVASVAALAAPVDKPMRFSGKVAGGTRTWSFPYLVDPENPQAAARINEYLHIAELESAPPAMPQTSIQVVEEPDAIPEEQDSEGVMVLNGGTRN